MTLVSFQHNFVYLRTRKTASTSVEMYLQPFCMPAGQAVSEYNRRQIISDVGIVGRRLRDTSPPLHIRASGTMRRMLGRPNWRPHMSAQEVHANLPASFWSSALKVSSVRNPFARTVSSFFWFLALRDETIDEPMKLVSRFRYYVRNGRFHDDREIVTLDGQFLPDVLIRQEHLAGDLAALSERLGLDTSQSTLPVTKKTKSSDKAARPTLRAFYNDKTADIVRERFAWAFEHGPYPLEVPE